LMLLMGMMFLLMVFYWMLVTMFLLLERILFMMHWFKILDDRSFFGVVSHVIAIDTILTQVLVFIDYVVLVYYYLVKIYDNEFFNHMFGLERQGNYVISLISNCFRFVHLFSYINKSLVGSGEKPTKLCFGKLLIHIFYFFSSARCNIKV
jgi:hypothetical protein